MAIIRTILSDGRVETRSNAGFYIRGGYPVGLYKTAVDPARTNRTYEETDIKIPPRHAIVDGRIVEVNETE